jgi:hypothetical protein
MDEGLNVDAIAFSGEVSRCAAVLEENATKQKPEPRSASSGTKKTPAQFLPNRGGPMDISRQSWRLTRGIKH